MLSKPEALQGPRGAFSPIRQGRRPATPIRLRRRRREPDLLDCRTAREAVSARRFHIIKDFSTRVCTLFVLAGLRRACAPIADIKADAAGFVHAHPSQSRLRARTRSAFPASLAPGASRPDEKFAPYPRVGSQVTAPRNPTGV